MALPAGTRLGPYEIVALLGVGGMGEVYHARDMRLERSVAIKTLHGQSGTADSRSRFEREARAIAALSHSHICTIHDVGHHEGIDFLYAVTADGERFLVNNATDTILPITLMRNWTAALQR